MSLVEAEPFDWPLSFRFLVTPGIMYFAQPECDAGRCPHVEDVSEQGTPRPLSTTVRPNGEVAEQGNLAWSGTVGDGRPHQGRTVSGDAEDLICCLETVEHRFETG